MTSGQPRGPNYHRSLKPSEMPGGDVAAARHPRDAWEWGLISGSQDEVRRRQVLRIDPHQYDPVEAAPVRELDDRRGGYRAAMVQQVDTSSLWMLRALKLEIP